MTALALCAGALLVSSCADLDMPQIETTPDRTTAVGSDKDDAITVLDVEAGSILDLEQHVGDALPDYEVGPIVVTDMPVLDVIKLIAAPFDIAVLPSDDLRRKNVTIMDPKVRPLREAVEMIASTSGLFYEFRNGVLKLEGEKNFTLKLPNVMEVATSDSSDANSKTRVATLEPFSEAISGFGGRDVYVNNFSGLISFTANYPTAKRISDYVRKFEEGREVLVYNAWVYEVELDNNNKAGVHWEDLSTHKGAFDFNLKSAGANIVSEGLTLGITGNPGRLAVDTLLDFLKTQGETKAVSRPTLSMTSGGMSDFAVGDRLQYIKEIKLEENDTGDPVAQDVETAELETGIKMQVFGDHSNGIVYSRINLVLEDLVSFEEFEAGQVKLSLPHTKERRVYSELQSRPGDLLIIGGLIQDRGTTKAEKVLGLNLPLAKSAIQDRSELVIMMRPKLVRFNVIHEKPKAKEKTADILVEEKSKSAAVESGIPAEDDAKTDPAELKAAPAGPVVPTVKAGEIPVLTPGNEEPKILQALEEPAVEPANADPVTDDIDLLGDQEEVPEIVQDILKKELPTEAAAKTSAPQSDAAGNVYDVVVPVSDPEEK